MCTTACVWESMEILHGQLFSFNFIYDLETNLGLGVCIVWWKTPFPHLVILPTVEFGFNIQIFQSSYAFLHVFTRTIQMDTWENHSYPLSVVFALLGFYYEEILNLKFMRVMVVRTGWNWSHCFEDRKQRGER